MALPLPRQTDRHRRRYFEGFQRRFPALPLRWGNTFARWRDVPGTELVVSHYIANYSIGVFVRGQRGVPCIETAAQLPAFTLEIALEAPLGRPDFPSSPPCRSMSSTSRFGPAARIGCSRPASAMRRGSPKSSAASGWTESRRFPPHRHPKAIAEKAIVS